MDYTTREVIDLREYGMEGTIEMGLPKFTTEKRFQSKLLAITPRDKDGRPMVEMADLVVSEVLQILMYVRKAPFTPDMDPFYDFLDRVDGIELGNAEKLYNRMARAADTIAKGEDSPLAGSPAAETTDSV